MALYLDDARRPSGAYVLSTLIADTDKELQDAARRLGLDLAPAWIVTPEGSTDARAYVSPGLGALAVRFCKAVEISAEQCRAMRWHRRHYGQLGTPAGALERFRNEQPRTTESQKGEP